MLHVVALRTVASSCLQSKHSATLYIGLLQCTCGLYYLATSYHAAQCEMWLRQINSPGSCTASRSLAEAQPLCDSYLIITVLNKIPESLLNLNKQHNPQIIMLDVLLRKFQIDSSLVTWLSLAECRVIPWVTVPQMLSASQS